MKRNLKNKMVAGVCAGIADELKIDVTIVRLAFVVTTLIGMGLPLLVYPIMWVLMPTE